jgi:branched-chain amino acid transport system permease protein
MSAQMLMDGLVDGSLIALGAAGVTLTYGTLRFGNFAHGELVSAGAYLTLFIAAALGAAAPVLLNTPDGVTATPALWLSMVLGGLMTGLIALLLDRLVYRPLRARGAAMAVSMASFGVSMALRALIEVGFSARPRYYSDDLSIAWDLGFARVAPDRLLVLIMALVIFVALDIFLQRSRTGREMRAVGENPTLAHVVGIDVGQVLQTTWILGGALAGVAGVGMGLLAQIRPSMGAEMLLPMFAAAIVGGLGSLRGALIGGCLMGCGEAFAVAYVGAEWRAGVSFALLVVVLLLRPTGLFGRRA